MNKFYGLEPFSAGDKTFVFRPESERYNLLGYIVFEDDYDIEKVRKSIIERGIKRYKKMRSVTVYKNFEFWWKENSVEKVLKELSPFEERINQGTFETTTDLINYSYDDLIDRFNLENQLPYKFIFIKNEKGAFRNLILFKADHLFADGLGIVGLFTGLGENYDINLFPQSMTKNKMSFIQIVATIFYSPYLALYSFYRNLIGLRTGKTIFKSDQKISGFTHTAISKKYKFSSYSRINKKLGITFNDLMMNVFSASIRKYCIKYVGKVPKKLSVITPISNRSLPKDIGELNITNDTSAIACKLKIIKDPLREYKIISQEFKKNVRNFMMSKVVKTISDFCNDFLPYYLTKFMYGAATSNFDITFSNVALPKQELIYAGYPVKAFYPLISTGLTYAFIGIYSYNGYFSTTVCLDQALNMDPNKLVEIVEKELESIESKFE